MGSEDKKMNKNYFGSRLLDKFNVGDLVSWKDLGKDKKYGFIVNLYEDEKHLSDDRGFIFAKIQNTNGKKELIMLSCLTKES